MVLNKIDRLREQDLTDLLAIHDGAVGISALRNSNIDDLLDCIERALPRPARGSPAAEGDRHQPTV